MERWEEEGVWGCYPGDLVLFPPLLYNADFVPTINLFPAQGGKAGERKKGKSWGAQILVD